MIVYRLYVRHVWMIFIITHPTCTHIISIVSHFMRLCWSVQTGFYRGCGFIAKLSHMCVLCFSPIAGVPDNADRGPNPHVMFIYDL